MNLSAMRTSMTLDDAQLEQARQALVERESASRLVALGSSQPDLEPIPRRRSA
jgi:hypothetical protein